MVLYNHATYSYGQGAVYLAERLPNGQAGAFRWVKRECVKQYYKPKLSTGLWKG
ncbi:hypothetical protein [[Haemophilus] ducreyi]|uniref:hypothetical protein n=1 Tax=Haemophilus ducreyi TaxID=730 RepID=UPI001AD7F7FE|nr:hypothetical protein [[Haemophilus] ducreyi]